MTHFTPLLFAYGQSRHVVDASRIEVSEAEIPDLDKAQIEQRAAEKLAAGAAVEAIHLAEIALTCAPQHRGALEVSMAAHEKLETESGNFWLISWLRHQAGMLRERLAADSSPVSKETSQATSKGAPR